MIESVSYKCYNLLYAIYYYDIVSDEYQGITKLKLAKFIQIFIHQLLLLREKFVDLFLGISSLNPFLLTFIYTVLGTCFTFTFLT